MSIVFRVVLIIASIFLIGSILLQSEKSAGMGEITGAAESIWGRNKARSFEGKLERATTISAIVFLVSSLALVAFQ